MPYRALDRRERRVALLSALRPPTLAASLAPILVGSAAASCLDAFDLGVALLAAALAASLQVTANIADDYGDGVRGADDSRTGPARLTGSGAVDPRRVRAAGLVASTVAAVAGLALLTISRQWWLLPAGVACLAAAWLYTAGPRPYGYRGFGEVAVFVFFGPVATLGTLWTQAGPPWQLGSLVLSWSLCAAAAIGLLAATLLQINNLRDLGGDARAGKRTLAVILGQGRARTLLVASVTAPFAFAALVAVLAGRPWTLLTMAAVPLAVRVAVLEMRRTADAGSAAARHAAALRTAGLLELTFAVLLAVGLAL